MSYTAIIDEIYDIIDDANVGNNIYKYDRLETTEIGFRNAFKEKDTALIRAWTITRSRLTEDTEASRTNRVLSTWIIRGYYSLRKSGETETTFQGIIDTLRTAFREKPSLSGTCLTCSPLQLDTIESRMFGSILCHYMETRLVTEEEQTFAETE